MEWNEKGGVGVAEREGGGGGEEDGLKEKGLLRERVGEVEKEVECKRRGRRIEGNWRSDWEGVE